MQVTRRSGLVVLLSVTSTVVGCRRGGGGTADGGLPGDAYFRRQPAIADTIGSPVDRPGAVQYDPVKIDAVDDGDGSAAASDRVPTVGDADAIASGGVPAAVREQVQVVGAPTTSRPATAPSTAQSFAAPSDAGYTIVGFVLAQVHDRAIYAEDVLAAVDAALRAEARRLEPEAFRRFARDAIVRELQSQANNELEVAAAESQLTEVESELAERMTMQWKKQQITEAGGSVAMAARKWTQAAETFEDRLRREHRANLVRVYYNKRGYQRVTVSAADKREYYRRNVGTQFTQRAEATFELLRVAPATAEAREFAATLHHRAAAGESFAELAEEQPPADITLTHQPNVGPIQRGAFKFEKVEQAVWAVAVGVTTEVVEDADALHIARPTALQPEVVRPFDDRKVQAEIEDKIRAQSFQAFRQAFLARLRSNAILVEPTPDQVETVVDMAMQSYPGWHAAGA